MEMFLCEEKGLKQAIGPSSLVAATINGDRIGLKNLHRVAIVCSFGASASAVLDLSFEQHDAAVGGNSKALLVSNKYYHKVGAATSFTKVEDYTAAPSFDLSALVGNNKAIVVFEILQENLDVNAGFSHISANLLGDATARLIAVDYIGKAELLPAAELAL